MSSNNDQPAKVRAMMAWLKSKLEFAGYSQKEISGVEAAVGSIKEVFLEKISTGDGIQGLLGTVKVEGFAPNDSERYLLATMVAEYMQDFLVLDDMESGGYYDKARLPRSLLEQDKLLDYISAAEASVKSESTRSHLQFLKQQQERLVHKGQVCPNNYVCVIASSGTGKTQLAATASLCYSDATTIYLNMGGSSTQRFYISHIEGSNSLLKEAKKFMEERGTAHTETANSIKQWAESKDNGSSRYIRMIYHLLTKEPFRRDDLNAQLKLSEVKNRVKKKKYFVFLDEVPTKVQQYYRAVLCLRDTLRYLDIAPILMSTHTGAQDFVEDASRTSISTWTWIISTLPKFAPFPETPPPFLLDTERPYVVAIAKRELGEGKNNLLSIVRTIQERLQNVKPQAWITSPDLQLVQLFETDVEIKGDTFASAHSLVGHHFGWLVQRGENERGDNADVGRKKYNCGEAKLFGKYLEVAPVCAVTEPLLYLALVTWNEKMLENKTKAKFPLVNESGTPLTVRGAFNKCKASFKGRVSIDNRKAEKSDGNLLEVLVHAALTLASMKTDPDYTSLGGMALNAYIPLVRTLMLDVPFDGLPSSRWFSNPNNLNFTWPAVPALGSSNAGLPIELQQAGLCIGFLDRPADRAMVDGRIYEVRQVGTKQPFMSVECKNYKNGVDAIILKEAFKRIEPGIMCSLVFVSSVKNNIFAATDLESLKEECFKGHKNKSGISVVIWYENKENPIFLKVGGTKKKKFDYCKAKGRTSLLVVVIAVGGVHAEINRKRKLLHAPCANCHD